MPRKDPSYRKDPGRAPPEGKHEGRSKGLPRGDAKDKGGGTPPRRSMLRYTLAAAAVWLVLAGGLIVSHWIAELPDIAGLLVAPSKRDVTLLDIHDRVIARRGLTQGEFIAAAELPPYVTNAFIAVEDRRFRNHFGLDPVGTLRALIINTLQGGFVQGGSTITQQLAKNLLARPERTLKRKFQEALLALWLESRYTKDEILTLYLNRVYFGAGVFGIEAAAERFFGKTASDLSLKEAAILAGSLKAPSRYNPANDLDAASARAQVVLQAMLDAGFIDDAARGQANATRSKIVRNLATPGSGYFVDYALAQLSGFIGEDTGERLYVETTFDLGLQSAAEKAVTNGLNLDGEELNVKQGALVTMTLDGGVRALVGGRSYTASPFNRASEALRQPGSAFKAFVFLTALERGHSPNESMVDEPVQIGKWKPGNYEGRYEGSITMARALARSSNSVAVQLTREAGPAAVAKTAHRLGINSTLHAVPALALGTSEVTPLELTGAYTAIANGGEGVIPYSIMRVKTASGRVLYERQGSGIGRVVSERNAATMTEMMEGTLVSGTGRAGHLEDRPSAGKTGTSQDYRDAWFIGFTADYVCGVWIGNDDNMPMNKATGGGLPARIFKAFMSVAEADLPSRPLAAHDVEIASAEETPVIESVDDGAETAAKNDDGILDIFENVLDSLF